MNGTNIFSAFILIPLKGTKFHEVQIQNHSWSCHLHPLCQPSSKLSWFSFSRIWVDPFYTFPFHISVHSPFPESMDIIDFLNGYQKLIQFARWEKTVRYLLSQFLPCTYIFFLLFFFFGCLFGTSRTVTCNPVSQTPMAFSVDDTNRKLIK